MPRPGRSTETHTDYDVTAEDAPLGVPLWPTVSPAYARNFTLESVALVRDCNGEWVRWTYQSGKTRIFSKGERIACRAGVVDA